MTDFADAQLKLAQARKASESARAAAAAALEQQKALANAKKSLLRGNAPDSDAVKKLDARASTAANALSNARANAEKAAAAAAAALKAFEAFTDPRTNASRLSDDSPFALLPVRLETRFASVDSGSQKKHQLWVRIYPDDCSIDTFEAMLSATEIANAQAYWRGMFRAGGIEPDQRAAWRSLVAAHGSGRAGYIADNYLPTNPPPPPKVLATDVILVIATQTPLSVPEAGTITTYWQAFWVADGDAAKQDAARAQLETVVGVSRAAELVANYQPYNIADRPQAPLQKSGVALSTAFVVFPADPPNKQSSWSQAPQITQFPERFVVIGYNNGQKTLEAIGGVVAVPLYVGPDPSADPSTDPTSAIHPDGGDLFVPDQLKWMIDFDTAVAAGLGIAIDLTADQAANGFDRLLVLGLQLSAKDVDGKTSLEELLHHHAVGRSGLTFVPQGTPTHNTTAKGTGYTKLDNADQSFDDRKNAPLFTTTADPMLKPDGQWLAELLGLDPAMFTGIHGSGGKDQMQARAMQRALWPATIGYWMDKLLAPAFSDDTVDTTRWFFNNYVSGRGAVPAVRIGGQPYGVLPTTAFSRIKWLDAKPVVWAGGTDSQLGFLKRLFAILRIAQVDWTAMSKNNAHVGQQGDAHKILLDVVGLHPASVEYYSRSAESLAQLFNLANFWQFGPDLFNAVNAFVQHVDAAGLLQKFGYPHIGRTPPDILSHFFMKNADRITQVVDDRPLSETDPIRFYTDDNRNYIHWLIDAANKSLEAVRTEQGFSKKVTPQALLYLYLRHALMLGYYDSSYGLHKSAGFLNVAQLAAMKPEPNFIHIADANVAVASESRFAALYKTEPLITGNPTLLVSDYITQHLTVLPQSAGLKDQLDAMAILADASTAQLERGFAEHIDLCSYRFDAWLLGIVNYQLQWMRYGTQQGGQPKPGLYLGAYAWLEDLRPSTAKLSPAQVPADLTATFTGVVPIMQDSTNGGYVHAPSLTQARSAAVLRSGYLANATPANPDTMSINLSSDRVRLALSMLEGIRNGQNLGALLGYRFERGLHDDYQLVEVDKFIYPLRKAFPLVADKLSTTRTLQNVPIEAIEARNVLDGRKLLAQIAAGNAATYPFGLPALPAAGATEAAAINAQVNIMRDIYDAIADLALAEGVHQAVQGNFERIGATLEAYSSGNFPPDPEVVQTRPGGIGLTYRVAVHFRSGLAAPASATPRATVEPALDDWLATVLPPIAQIGCTVTWNDANGAAQQQPVTLADLAVRPIDLLALVKPDQVQAMTELDDRILGFVIATAKPRPDAALSIAYMTAPAGQISIFEVTALIRQLKTLVTGARPLRATDASLSNDARPDQNSIATIDKARIAGPKGLLDGVSADMTAFLNTLKPMLADPVANRAAIIAAVDDNLDTAVSLLERAARFAVPLSGWGFAYAWRHKAVADLLADVQALLQRWNGRLADFDARILAYDKLSAGTDDIARFRALRAAERLVSTKSGPLPATPPPLRTALDAERTTFVKRRDAFAVIVASSSLRFADYYNATAALLPISDFDSQKFDVKAFGDRAVLLTEDLNRTIAGHVAAIDKRRATAQSQLATHDAATSTDAQTAALVAAAQALLGDDFRVFPEFSLPMPQGDEWANAVGGFTSGKLLSYLTTTAATRIENPVDEWLYGVARVRPMMHAFEATVMLAGALGGAEPDLMPIQFPYADDASWLAMEFPATPAIDSDRLLYTAQYLAPFDKTLPQCGMLLDDWTEVIPDTTLDTGITFNFNRPDNEPPQSILLVTPASASGTWQWDDLVDALNETLDLAKLRSVEPTQLDDASYAPLLPATVMAVTMYAISISTSLAVANGTFVDLEALQNG
jgi:hypothetical protein